MTWTIIVDYEGGTYVSQFTCPTLKDAIAQYNKTDPSGQKAVPIDDDPITPLVGVRNVWCATGLGPSDKLILANIILTQHD